LATDSRSVKAAMQHLVYIDVCALSRPFDDQAFLRIRLETVAINLVLSKIKEGQLRLVVSPVHFAEIRAIPDALERLELLSILERYGILPEIDRAGARKRAEEFIGKGFGPADAAHLAFAEACNAKFITCDDKLLKKCAKYDTKTWYGSPVLFCTEEDLK
jgi:predicted nucleic acid-binding protein